jgi:hypothetical protein
MLEGLNVVQSAVLAELGLALAAHRLGSKPLASIHRSGGRVCPGVNEE